MPTLFEGQPRKNAVVSKILEGNFEVHGGNYAHALQEYQLDMNVTQLRSILGSLIHKNYVRRYRCEPPVATAVYGQSVAGERGVTLTVDRPLRLIPREIPRNPYLNHEVWLYLPTNALTQLAGVRSDQPRATFAR